MRRKITVSVEYLFKELGRLYVSDCDRFEDFKTTCQKYRFFKLFFYGKIKCHIDFLSDTKIIFNALRDVGLKDDQSKDFLETVFGFIENEFYYLEVTYGMTFCEYNDLQIEFLTVIKNWGILDALNEDLFEELSNDRVGMIMWCKGFSKSKYRNNEDLLLCVLVWLIDYGCYFSTNFDCLNTGTLQFIIDAIASGLYPHDYFPKYSSLGD